MHVSLIPRLCILCLFPWPRPPNLHIRVQAFAGLSMEYFTSFVFHFSTIPVSLTWPSSSRKRLLASSFHPRALPFERTCLSWAHTAPISLYIMSLQTLQVAFLTRR